MKNRPFYAQVEQKYYTQAKILVIWNNHTVKNRQNKIVSITAQAAALALQWLSAFQQKQANEHDP